MNWTQRRKRDARRRGGLIGAAVCAGGIVLLSLAGLLLGAEQVVSGEAMLDRPPETIWRVLTDFDGMPLWRSDLTALERLPDLGGRPAWREIGRKGTRILELATAEPPRRLVVRRAQGGLPSLPMRTFELAPRGRGTLLTVTERDLVRNPLRRVLNRLLPPRAPITRFLRDLAQRLGGGRGQVAAIPETR